MTFSSANALRRWLSRALAFSPWARSIDRAARSASFLAPVPPKPHPSTNAAAVRTWHTVSSGFFPPKLPVKLGQQEKAHRTDDLVALQPQITLTFPMIKTQFRFAILKAPLHMPSRQPDQKQRG